MRKVLLAVLLVLVLGGIAIWVIFARDLHAARARIAGQGHTIETPFGKLQYAERGRGDPVLAIHGSGGGFDQGFDMAGALAGGYRLIAPSRFGYLGSDFPQGATLDMQADAFATLLDSLGIDKAFVFGGSAGALSAMAFAIRYPDRCRALVLLVPAAYAPTRVPNTNAVGGPLGSFAIHALLYSDFVFWSARKLMPDLMTKILIATDPALVKAAAPQEQARVHAILDHILPISARAEGLLMDMATAGDPQPQDLKAITCPVLTVSMQDDLFGTYDPAKYIAATVPDGRAVTYPTGGHVWVGHDADVWREIAAFLASVKAGGG